MSNAKNTSKGTDQRNAESTSKVDQMSTQRSGQTKGGMNEKNTRNEENCGPARPLTDIQPHMDVISSCGCNMGKVDHLEGETIKLTKNDSPDGQHHFIPTSWVRQVDEHVHLSKNAEDTLKEWKPDAASCANGRA
jgi:hypothetical protein